jgi:hypothetical protein
MKTISPFLAFLLCFSAEAFAQTIPIRETTPLPLGVLFFDAAQLPGGDVIAFGGGTPVPGDQTWRYDWETEEWTEIAPLAYPVSQSKSVALSNGDILCVGGTLDFSGKEQRSQLFKVATQTWEEKGQFEFLNPVYTTHSVLSLPGDYVLLTTTNGDFSVYDPATGAWSDQDAPAPLDGGGSPMVWLEDQEEVLFCGAGGQIFQPGVPPTAGNLFYLNPAQPLYQDGVVRLSNGHVLTMDLELSFNNFVTDYDPVTRVASQASPVPFNSGVNSRSAVLMADGKVLTFGFGDIANPNDTKLIQVYNPATDEWEVGTYTGMGTFGAPRMFLLPDSSILAISTVSESIEGTFQNRCWIINRDEASAVKALADVPETRVFPNPSAGMVFFEDMEEPSTLRLFGSDGSSAGEWPLQNGALELPHISNGLYFFLLYSDSGELRSSGKILIQK